MRRLVVVGALTGSMLATGTAPGASAEPCPDAEVASHVAGLVLFGRPSASPLLGSLAHATYPYNVPKAV